MNVPWARNIPAVVPDGWFRLDATKTPTYTRVHEGMGVGIVQQRPRSGGWWAFTPHVDLVGAKKSCWRSFGSLEDAKAWCWQMHERWMAKDATERLGGR